MKSKTIIIAVVIALLAVVGGAYFILNKNNDGAESSSNNEQGPTNSEQAPESLGQRDIDDAVGVVEKFISAYFANDSNTACSLVTDNYIKQIAEKEDSPDDCEGQVETGSALAKAFSIEANDFTHSGRIENDTVIVASKWNGDEGTEDYEMIKDDGVWKINAEIEVVSEEDEKQEKYNAVVEEWNNLSQTERDSWYKEDGTGGFDAYAKSKGVETE